MFPIIAIESAYQDHWSPDWKPSGPDFTQIGSLCEQWLLSFTGSDPAEEAINALSQTSRKDHDKRMTFAMTMSLCTPSQHTVELINRYQRHIKTNGYDIGHSVTAIAMVIHDQSPLDLMKIFRDLPPRLYDAAVTAYRITLNELATNAVACDDLIIFEKCFDKNYSQTWADRFVPLAKFPVDSGSKIYQSLIQDPDAEQDFLHARLFTLRGELTDEHAKGSLYKRCIDDKKITLMPGGFVDLDHTRHEAPVHKEHGFAEQLMSDPARHTQVFFAPLGQWSTDSVNQAAADEITQAFLDAGVSPLMILTIGAREMGVETTYSSPNELLLLLKSLSEQDRKFFRKAYLAYLKDFSPKEILASCERPDIAQIVYQMTGNKALLQSGDDKVRSAIIGADLGL
ncbi:hypothetical protein [Pseudomonas amygdali]|uniref:Uncharacterized protein n=2 Tax=Pseudomonas amygdali pv. lachrymans TaxID=53707 RepID=A0ABR5KR30_PSEAV|nr:hypothetical protein [Pseudomonas amygdali]AXH59569.1 hypothetical protein PLA107_030555 [Pseudomonas amygdali pv. lachrymans str. M301315]KPC16995.1 Uncharacterized protein AC499_0197 [Pseudomonas amygdali pv. lachrymans]KPC17954.1 Uncharacterized protein AC499_1156 [Pseudomonas amygdali pv. lachrymans]RMT06383.1 hypothetical protein ALP54_03490 [Pseudomonas amygdali pv. lachrymans]